MSLTISHLPDGSVIVSCGEDQVKIGPDNGNITISRKTPTPINPSEPEIPPGIEDPEEPEIIPVISSEQIVIVKIDDAPAQMESGELSVDLGEIIRELSTRPQMLRLDVPGTASVIVDELNNLTHPDDAGIAVDLTFRDG